MGRVAHVSVHRVNHEGCEAKHFSWKPSADIIRQLGEQEFEVRKEVAAIYLAWAATADLPGPPPLRIYSDVCMYLDAPKEIPLYLLTREYGGLEPNERRFQAYRDILKRAKGEWCLSAAISRALYIAFGDVKM